MRIIAGTARGRLLVAPKSRDIRPTADRVREAVFNILGQWFEGQSVLDLYAGTGALALEALSRGAARAVLVDRDRTAVGLCESNAESLGFLDRVEILAAPVERAVERLGRSGAQFDLIFADPPYAAKAAADVVGWVGAFQLLRAEGTLCIEHDKRESVPDLPGRASLVRVDQRKFGDTCVSVFRFA